jgi:predicted ATP-grasp superfamily ATP-dependent carboligase
MTTYGRVVRNPRLASEASTFCKRIGFSGIVDMDWRLDRRDDVFRLLDCNPRVGAQFRLFENDAGVDVVRALHLDLTRRAVPEGAQIEGRGFIVENHDAMAALAYRRLRTGSKAVPHATGSIERAWFAWDDPLPFVGVLIRLPRMLLRRLRRSGRGVNGLRKRGRSCRARRRTPSPRLWWRHRPW